MSTLAMTHEAISKALCDRTPLTDDQRSALIGLVVRDRGAQDREDANAADAARYRWVRKFLAIDDVGDEKSVWALVVSGERMEEAACQAKCWDIEGYMLEDPTPDAAIDAAIGKP